MNDICPSLNLIVQHYRCPDAARQTEIDTCLRENLLNPYLSRVHQLVEEEFDFSPFPGHEKIVQTVIGERLTFERVFRYANEADPAGEQVWILANADIYFDDTLRLVERENLDGAVYALTRHDVQADGSIQLMPAEHAHGSQDAWIFLPPIPLDRLEIDFYLGVPGCDNKILYELLQADLLVTNPAKAIRAIHLDLARNVAIDARIAEYALGRSEENISRGRMAPGPYQYFLYPLEDVRAHKEGAYRLYLDAISMLTRFDELSGNQQKELASLKQELASQQMKNAELNYKLQQLSREHEAVLSSATWKYTASLRDAIDSAKQLAADKDEILRNITHKLALRKKDTEAWIRSVNSFPGPVAIVPCAFEFNELVNQRPINLAKYLAAHGFLVIYAAWQWHENHRIKAAYQEVFPNIIQVPYLDLLKKAHQISVENSFQHICFVTFPVQNYVKTLPIFRQRGFAVVYDIMDDWESFHEVGEATWYERDYEEQAVLSADVVSAVSTPLRDKFKHLRNDIVCIGNGFTPALLGAANRNISLRSESPDGKIVVGYVGHMTDAWLDWENVIRMCETNEQIVVHLVGYGASPGTLRRMKECRNIVYHGKVPPQSLHTIVKTWQVAMIPFMPGKLSDAVDPIKVYEYLYFGLPVVVTGIGSIAAYPGVHYCDDAGTLAEKILSAYQSIISEGLDRSSIEEFLQACTWERRFDQLLLTVSDSALIQRIYA